MNPATRWVLYAATSDIAGLLTLAAAVLTQHHTHRRLP